MDILIVIGLICMSGLFSGLTIGLMGLSFSEVKRAADLGNENAKVVLGIISDSNRLLVTLLLGNTAVNSTLSIFLGKTVGEGIVAGIIATVLILIFGEILPASILTKYALKVGAITAPLVRLLMSILFIITKPISMALDKFVGKIGETFFSRRELIHIVETHGQSSESDIDDLDKRSIIGIMKLTEKQAGDHMTKKPFTINKGTLITEDLIVEIREKGHTRVPIMDSTNSIFGILHAKDLLAFNVESNKYVEDMVKNKPVLTVSPNAELDNVLSTMLAKKYHIAVVTSFETVVGVITLEDIMEELLLQEIVDEHDQEE